MPSSNALIVTDGARMRMTVPVFRADYELAFDLLFDIPRLISLCKRSMAVEHFIGTIFFDTYAAYSPFALSEFLYIINEHPPLARYVRKIVLSSDKDGPANSGIYKMLLNIANEKNKKMAATSLAFQTIAEDFYLISFGDIEDVPECVHLQLMQQLFSVAENVLHVKMPKAWYDDFAVRFVFPRLVLSEQND